MNKKVLSYKITMVLTKNSFTQRYINNQKMLIAYFHLTQDDIARLDMSCKVRIDNSYWNINRIIDYEIITVDNPFAIYQTYTLPTPFFIPKGCYLTADHRYTHPDKTSQNANNLNLRNNYIINGYQA